MSKTNIDIAKALEQHPIRVTDTKATSPNSTCNIIDPRGSPMSWRSKRFTKSIRAGLKMPVGRIHKNLKKGNLAPRIGLGAAVYLAAVLEYLVAEILELAAQAANDNRKIRISPRHLLMAIRHDDELNCMLDETVLREGGTVPKAQPAKPPKKTKSGKSRVSRIAYKD